MYNSFGHEEGTAQATNTILNFEGKAYMLILPMSALDIIKYNPIIKYFIISS